MPDSKTVTLNNCEVPVAELEAKGWTPPPSGPQDGDILAVSGFTGDGDGPDRLRVRYDAEHHWKYRLEARPFIGGEWQAFGGVNESRLQDHVEGLRHMADQIERLI